MVPRSAYAARFMTPADAGRAAFAWGTTLVNAQPAGA
jgi:hypothetical protein